MATEQMFCFQCEQVAKCEACTGGAGVCGKPADVADAQDALTGAMIALARTAREAGVKNDRICDLIVDGLFTCMKYSRQRNLLSNRLLNILFPDSLKK